MARDIRRVTRVDGSLIDVVVTFENYLGFTGYPVQDEQFEDRRLIVAWVDNNEVKG